MSDTNCPESDVDTETDTDAGAGDSSSAETESSVFDPRTATYHCKVCGAKLSFHEYVAVGPGTPAAKHLGLEDKATDSNRVGNQTSDDDEGRDHFIVCEECFERATADIAENGMNDLP